MHYCPEGCARKVTSFFLAKDFIVCAFGSAATILN